LQQIRGINGAPGKVAQIGGKQYIVQPGVYGEFKVIDEQMVLTRRQWGSFGSAINIADLVLDAQEHLLQRRLDRIELIGWSILQGTYSVAGPNGSVMATDTYTVQSFDAATTWATVAGATPLADFRTVKLKHRGHSVSFGSNSRAFMNQVTFNNLIGNTNNEDLFGRRQEGLSTINNVHDVNKLFGGDDLPQIVIYDEGYLDETAAFQPFIPNNKVIVVGKRPAGQYVGEYRMTRNINNPDLAPGAYTRVIVEDHVPPTIEVHDGHSGGPVIWYPSAIVVMSV